MPKVYGKGSGTTFPERLLLAEHHAHTLELPPALVKEFYPELQAVIADIMDYAKQPTGSMAKPFKSGMM